jgi:DNA repair exonuclease SbcCD ATPase subunit
VLNNADPKKLSVCVEFDNYKVTRNRKPNSLKFEVFENDSWKDNTRGTMKDTQDDIESILGLNYESFISIVVFSDDNSASFLECSTVAKRKIIENLLGLEKFEKFLETAKEKSKDLKKQISESTIIVQQKNRIQIQYDTELSKLHNQSSKYIDEINAGIDKQNNIIQKERSKTFTDYDTEMEKFTNAQGQISVQNGIIVERNAMIQKANEYISQRQAERTPWLEEVTNLNHLISSLDLEKNSMNSKIQNLKKDIHRLSCIEHGVKCNSCLGIVDVANRDAVISDYTKQIEKINLDIATNNSKYAEPKSALQKMNEKIIGSKDLEKKANEKLNLRRQEIQTAQKIISGLLIMKQPVKDNAQQQSEEAIVAATTMLDSLKSRLDSANPYQQQIDDKKELIEKVKKEIEEMEASISQVREDVPYYDFWIDAFGDDGIRKFAIEQIIDLLNTSIENWMDLLIGDSIVLKFDSSLDVKITKFPFSGRDFVYDTLSNGQRRRLNLAVTLAISHVMSIINNVQPNIIFLDEVSTNIDQQGVVGIYKIIQELAEKRKVFVTTHDTELNNMLGDAQKLNLLMKNGTTKVVAKFE